MASKSILHTRGDAALCNYVRRKATLGKKSKVITAVQCLQVKKLQFFSLNPDHASSFLVIRRGVSANVNLRIDPDSYE